MIERIDTKAVLERMQSIYGCDCIPGRTPGLLHQFRELCAALGQEIADREADQAHIEALEKEAATLHAALMVFEAGWSTGGYLDPLDFWDKCFPRLNDLVPPEHRSFVWAVAQEMRDRAPLRGK